MSTAIEQAKEEAKRNLKPVTDFVAAIPERMKAKQERFVAENGANTDLVEAAKRGALNAIETSQKSGNAFGIADYAAESINQQGGVMPVSPQAQEAYGIPPTGALPPVAVAGNKPGEPVTAIPSPSTTAPSVIDSALATPGGPKMQPSHGPGVPQSAIPAASTGLIVKQVDDGYIIKKADGSVHLTNNPLEYGSKEEIDAGLAAGKDNKTWFSGPAGGNPTATKFALPDYRGDYAKETGRMDASATGQPVQAIPGERDSSRDKILGRESESDYVNRRKTGDIAAYQGSIDRNAEDASKTTAQRIEEANLLKAQAEERKASLHAAVQQNLYNQALKTKDNNLLLMLAGVAGKSAIPEKGKGWTPFTDKSTGPDGIGTTETTRFYRDRADGTPEIYDPNAATGGSAISPQHMTELQRALSEAPEYRDEIISRFKKIYPSFNESSLEGA